MENMSPFYFSKWLSAKSSVRLLRTIAMINMMVDQVFATWNMLAPTQLLQLHMGDLMGNTLVPADLLIFANHIYPVSPVDALVLRR